MARLTTEGFELGAIVDPTLSDLSSVGPTWVGVSGRNGGYGYGYNSAGGAAYTLDLRMLMSGVSEIYFKAALRINPSTSEKNITVHLTAGSTFSITFNTNNTITYRIPKVTSGVDVVTAGGTYPTDAYFLIEFRFKVDSTASGKLTVKVNGVQIDDLTRITANSGSPTIDYAQFYNGDARYAMYIDDLGINDSSGGVDDTWIGDTKIVPLLPTGNGTNTQLVGSDGNQTDNYLLVDERPPASADYVYGVAANEKDSYAATNPSFNAGDVIRRVIVYGYGIETVAEAKQFEVGVLTNSVEYYGTPATLNISTYTRALANYRLNPDTGTAWTQSEIAALELAVRVL